MKIGDSVFVIGCVDEIRKDTIIVRNEGGYFGTIPEEIVCRDNVEAYWRKAERNQLLNEILKLIPQNAADFVLNNNVPLSGEQINLMLTRITKSIERLKEGDNE